VSKPLNRMSAPVEGIAQLLSDTWIWPYFARIRRDWTTVALYSVTAGLAAALVLIALPNVYVSRATIITDVPESKGLSGTLAQVAGQLGISGGNLDITAPAQFYSDLIRSRTVLEGLALTAFRDPRSGTLRSLYTILSKTDSVTPKGMEDVIRRLSKDIDLTVDARTGVTRVGFAARSPDLAAAVLDSLIATTNHFAIENLQARAKARRQFTQEQVDQARVDLATAEDSMRLFIQRNRRIEDSPQLQFETGRLRRRLDLRQEIYISLSRELEQAKIDEVRNTPVLRIIDAPRPPARHERPKRRAYVLLALVAGAALAVLGLTVAKGPLPAAS
jgi:uncharacterized protein involved in exopolysaccharide biosynthesis